MQMLLCLCAHMIDTLQVYKLQRWAAYKDTSYRMRHHLITYVWISRHAERILARDGAFHVEAPSCREHYREQNCTPYSCLSQWKSVHPEPTRQSSHVHNLTTVLAQPSERSLTCARQSAYRHTSRSLTYKSGHSHSTLATVASMSSRYFHRLLEVEIGAKLAILPRQRRRRTKRGGAAVHGRHRLRRGLG